LGDGGTGGSLFFVARDMAGRGKPGAVCDMTMGGTAFASFRLPPPTGPLHMLARGDERQSLAMLRFLVGSCAGLFRVATHRDFAATCHRLGLQLLGDTPARAACRPGSSLSLWRVPPVTATSWFLVSAEGIRRVDPPSEDVLLVSGRPAPPDAYLLPASTAGRPIPLAPIPAKSPSLREVVQQAIADSVEAPSRIAAALGRRATHDAAVAALIREVQLLAPARPKSLLELTGPVSGSVEVAVADQGGGVFVSGWLRDPIGLVQRIELRSAFAARLLPLETLHRFPRPDLTESQGGAAFAGGAVAPGFAAHLPEGDHAAVAQWRVVLRLHSGESLNLVASPSRLAPAQARDIVLGSVRPSWLSPGMLEGCIAPAVARLHRAALARPATPDVVQIGGVPPARPAAAIIVPIYRTLRFLRFQIAAFARDPDIAGACEIIYVLDSPEQRLEVEMILKGASSLHGGLPVTLLVMPENRGYATACNAGAAVASAPVLAMLNSDVLPQRRGWLGPLAARLAEDRTLAAIGPRLLFEDGALQHAGMLFRRGIDGQWLNHHYFKGFPRDYAPATQPRAVPAVTGAALLVRRHDFEAVGGFCTDYVIGDFEDSDLCLALRERGGEIAYEPSVELMHFERQSITEHGGHARTLAGAYNRQLHHRKWDATIDALMARFGEEY
jgi:GT2 family glycosyltransferase